MKRITALAALVLALLAVPATAMASTGSPAQGPEPGPGPLPVKCVPPPGYGNGPGPRVFCCAVKRSSPGQVAAAVCRVPLLVFDMPAWSRVAHEVRGPALRAHEVIFYRGRIYTVASAWGNAFILDLRGRAFVNRGPAIHDGHAIILGGVTIVVGPPPKR